MLEILAMLVLVFFPLAYARYRKVRNFALFVFASFGFVGVFSVLATLALVPVFILQIFILPQVESLGIGLGWYGILFRLISEPAYALFGAVLGVVGPILLLRRYPEYF